MTVTGRVGGGIIEQKGKRTHRQQCVHCRREGGIKGEKLGKL